MRPAIMALALLLCFGVGMATARAYIGWERMETPCTTAATSVAVGGGKIIVTCADDTRIYLRDR